MRIPLFYAVSAALFLSGFSCLAQPLDATESANTGDHWLVVGRLLVIAASVEWSCIAAAQ
ncbi:hypothetical protein AB7M23_003376 [Pseudomonas sp. HLS-6 TE3448]